MSVDETLMDTEERMEKAISVLGDQLSGIRTGRANPGLVDSLKVEVYGSMQPLKQLASIGTPEPQQIVIRPYDAGTIKEIEKAVSALPQQELAKFRAWFEEYDAATWDRRYAEDAESGKLDRVAEKAVEDYRKGKSRPIMTSC